LMLYLEERQLAEGQHHTCEACQSRIFSALHNVTEIGGVVTCRVVQGSALSNIDLKVVSHKKENHDYILKMVINILVAIPAWKLLNSSPDARDPSST
jgi:hypothetical protein